MKGQEVILVNEADEAIGVMEKMEAHRKALLHRAFSVFIFNSDGKMLLQQRADNKYHSAGLWTNACCSHPLPGEKVEMAAARRLKEELGFSVPLSKIFAFTYTSSFSNGLTENEYDHVFTGLYDGKIQPDSNEVKAIAFKSMEEIDDLIRRDPQQFTSWFLIAFPRLRNWRETNDNL
jgi:isopentenyl-diphosphate delta-isomerase